SGAAENDNVIPISKYKPDTSEARQLENLMKAMMVQAEMGKELFLTKLTDGRYAFRPERVAENPEDRQRQIENAFYSALKRHELTLKEYSERTGQERRPGENMQPAMSSSGPAGSGGGYRSLAEGDARDYETMCGQYEAEIMRIAQRITQLVATRIMN